MVVALLENTTILLGRRAVRADPKNICFKKNHAYLPTPDPVPCPTHHRVQLALRKGINERVNGVPRLCKVAEAKQRIRMALRAVAEGGTGERLANEHHIHSSQVSHAVSLQIATISIQCVMHTQNLLRNTMHRDALTDAGGPPRALTWVVRLSQRERRRSPHAAVRRPPMQTRHV